MEGSKKGVTMVEGTDDMASVEGGMEQRGEGEYRPGEKEIKEKKELMSGVHALVMGIGNNL